MAIRPNIPLWVLYLITILFAVSVGVAISFWIFVTKQALSLAAAATEERYRLLFERSLSSAYRTTLDGRILDCNVSFCQMFGYAAREEIIGKSVDIGYLNKVDRDQFIARLRTKKTLTNFEQHLRRADGGTITVLNSATLVEEGSEPIIKGTLTDITELRNAEQEQRRLAAIVQCSDDAIFSLTLEGVIETWNAGAERIFGYSTLQMTGRSIAVLAPADRQEEYLQILETIAKGHEVRLETIRTCEDGRCIDVALSVSPITDAAGHVIGAATIVRDVTQEKETERALRKSEIHFRLLFERNPVPMWVFDRSTLRFLAVNKAAILQYGYSEQEFLKLTVSDIRPEESIPEMLEDVAKRGHGLQKPGVWKHRRKDGSIIEVEIVCHDLDFKGNDAMLVAAFDVTERQQAKKMLEESEHRYRVLFEGSPDAYWLMDANGFVDCNTAGMELFGYENKADFIDPASISPDVQPNGMPSRTAADQRIAAAFRNGKERFEWVHRRKNSDEFFADVALASLKLNGRSMLLASVRDIDERKKTEEALKFKSALLEAQSETTLDGILAVDQSGKIVLANQQFRLQFGLPQELIESQNDSSVLQYCENMMEAPDVFIKRVNYLYHHPNERSSDELKLKDGRTFDRYSAPLIDSSGQHRGRIWYFRDITDRKTAEARIQHLAYYDALTELPNRALFSDRLEIALAGARRRGEKVAMLFLDLDRFTVINDSLGRSVGDQLLREIAQRLKHGIREQDTVARIGGDEFGILLNAVRDVAEAGVTAGRLIELVAQPFEILGRTINIGCSVGICVFPQNGTDSESLLKSAEAAMHCAKDDGRNSFRFFAEAMNGKAAEQLAIEIGLRTALARSEFALVYQPEISLASGRIIGMEALIRWRHPELGLVPPDQFIRIAENNGLILPIGTWVLRTACRQLCQWRSMGFSIVPVAVNVSAVQFRNDNFCTLVKEVLLETGLPPECLELELTESLLLSNVDRTTSVLSELKHLGIKIAIDDFGTGYSSLSYLKQFRVEKLKIDRSFVKDLPANEDDVAITTAIISMAKSMKLTVIAEGVETEEQVAFLGEHNCDQVQGYYFSKPVAPDKMAAKLESLPVASGSAWDRAFGFASR